MRSDRNTTCAVVDILLSPHISYNDQGTGQSFFATIRNFHLNSIIKSNKVSESAAGQMEKNWYILLNAVVKILSASAEGMHASDTEGNATWLFN